MTSTFTRLAVFDLDNTLLDGDSDVLWGEFLMDQGILERAEFGPLNIEMERSYHAGTVSAEAFCSFFVATLKLKSMAGWEPLRREFLSTVIAPRIGQAARDLVQRHRHSGDLLLMSTATNRFITELTAAHLGCEHLIATECEQVGGRFTGHTTGVLNMREGKVQRLHTWLAERGLTLGECDSVFYSDSANDLPLLNAVKHPVAVNADARLAAVAAERGWPTLCLDPTSPIAVAP